MKRLLIVVVMMMCFAPSSYGKKNSQQVFSETMTDDGTIYWTTWKYNWFFAAGIGYEWRLVTPKVSEFTLEGVPTYDVSVGKWISPFIALQFKYNYAEMNGYSEYNNIFTNSDNSIKGSLSTIHFDVMFNLSAIIAGYKFDRVYRLVPYVGAGLSMPNGNGEFYTKDYITVGVINNFRVNEKLDLKVVLKTSASNMGHYGVVDDNNQRHRIYPVTLSFGVTYNLGKTVGFSLGSDEAPVEYLDRIVVQKEIERVVDTVQVEKYVKELVFAGSVIKFDLNSSKLTKISRVNLSYIARAINASTSDKVYTIVGYCDVQTGSPEWNMGLSERRARAVYDALVNEFGVDKNRLKIDFKGGVDLMFYDDNRLSRVVILE